MDIGLLGGWLARLPPTLRVCIAFWKLIAALGMVYLFLAPLYGSTAEPLATWWGQWRKKRIKVGGTVRAGQDATNGFWAVGRGHTIHARYMGSQQLWGGPPPAPGGPELSYGHTRYPETETKHHGPDGT